jgi:hypothetical protein
MMKGCRPESRHPFLRLCPVVSENSDVLPHNHSPHAIRTPHAATGTRRFWGIAISETHGFAASFAGKGRGGAGRGCCLTRNIRKLKRAVASPLAARLIQGWHEIGSVDRIFGHYGAAAILEVKISIC